MTDNSAHADITTSYQAIVDQVLNMQNTTQNHMVIGYTPDVYRSFGMPSLPFVIGTGHIYYTEKSEDEANQVGNEQKSLLLPIEITAERTVNGMQMDGNALSSIYDKTVATLVNEAIALENVGDVGIYYAKKEAMTLPAAGVQFPIRLQQSIASDGIIHKLSEKVEVLNMNQTSALI